MLHGVLQTPCRQKAMHSCGPCHHIECARAGGCGGSPRPIDRHRHNAFKHNCLPWVALTRQGEGVAHFAITSKWRSWYVGLPETDDSTVDSALFRHWLLHHQFEKFGHNSSFSIDNWFGHMLWHLPLHICPRTNLCFKETQLANPIQCQMAHSKDWPGRCERSCEARPGCTTLPCPSVA